MILKEIPMRLQVSLILALSFFAQLVFSSEIRLSDLAADRNKPELFEFNKDKDNYAHFSRKKYDTSSFRKRAVSFDRALNEIDQNKKIKRFVVVADYLSSETFKTELKMFKAQFDRKKLTVGVVATQLHHVKLNDQSGAMEMASPAFTFIPGIFDAPVRKIRKSLSAQEQKLLEKDKKKKSMKRL